MLSQKDKDFINYWEKERNKQGTTAAKIRNGLPMAIMFSLPIVLLVFVVQIFLPEWNTRISNLSRGTYISIMLAVFISTLFFSYFRMHYKWEMNEQLYRELILKQVKEDNSTITNQLTT